MDKFQPFSLDYDVPAQGELLGDVKAGFPSPAEDIREKLDLIKLLVRHKASTFFFRVSGFFFSIAFTVHSVHRLDYQENYPRND